MIQKLYLGSSSNYRKELIEKNLKIKIEDILNPSINEQLKKSEKPLDYVKRISTDKFNSIKEQISDGFLITADTIVARNSRVFGKPKDSLEARSYLERLSGCRHRVYTCFTIGLFEDGKLVKKTQKVVQTIVKFKNLSEQEIEFYLSTNESMGSSGGYLLEGQAARFIELINGCYYNVIGMPVSAVYKSLKGMGWLFYE